jgi:beta-galactosidase
LKEKKLTVKAKLRNLARFQVLRQDPLSDTFYYTIRVFEKKGGRAVAEYQNKTVIRREAVAEISAELSLESPHAWTPDDPFLYGVRLTVGSEKQESDRMEQSFGMRDFERRGKAFYLNSQKIFLRGSNITLQRFFEDPECSNLAWDKAWVKKMLIDIPKGLDWNSMRICVSVVPDFWYDLADEYGLLLQNEWLYWQHHGWDEQVKKEYTDWVWADGSHASIAIWDAINENRDDYIGNTLIPELKKLDPTRIWDAGYMTASHMADDEMDEPHTYMGRPGDNEFKKNPYPLGNLDFRPAMLKKMEQSNAAQLVNEYGWVWLWRDGTPSKLTTPVYNYYLGDEHTAEQRRNFQAYWLQCETEWLRSNRSIAGVLAFCLLTNNYGYTGDWFVGHIKDLAPGPALYWFQHCFAETSVFINLTDERYARGQAVHTPGSKLNFSLAGINDAPREKAGLVTVRLLNSKGVPVFSDQLAVTLPPSERRDIPFGITLPAVAGGYMLETAFTEKGKTTKLKSRRYIKVGRQDQYDFYEPVIPSAKERPGNINP